MLTLAGTNLENAEVTSQHLGINSVRIFSIFLCKLKAALTAEEDQMLKGYHSGESTANAQKLSPCLKMLPNLEGCTSLFLKPWGSSWFDLLSAQSKTLYSACVIAFNKLPSPFTITERLKITLQNILVHHSWLVE